MPRLTDDDLEHIVGAFWQPDISMFRALLEATGDRIGGDLAELGVLYGRSAVLLGDHLRKGETLTVVDLFEDAAPDPDNLEENLSSYPGLTRAAFEDNYRRMLGTLPQVVQGLSHTIEDHAPAGAHRFVHVDASHLYEHVVKDIEVAHRLLKPDGILVLDDFRTAHTPGVAAAAWQAVLTSSLRPFAVSEFKMYATWGDPEPWMSALRAWATAASCEIDVQQVNDRPLLRVHVVRSSPHPALRYLPEVVWPAGRKVRAAARSLRRGA